MATPPSDQEQSLLVAVPDDWADGEYVALLEVNTEGDYNDFYNETTYPTPTRPTDSVWDSWAVTYGYPYRGQPSVIYQVKFSLTTGTSSSTFSTPSASGYGDLSGFGERGGDMRPLDSMITDDSLSAPGSGNDRLHKLAADNSRFQVNVRNCAIHPAPDAPGAVSAVPVSDPKHSHQWGNLHFIVPFSDKPIDHYNVRFSRDTISAGDENAFVRGQPAYAAKIDTEALMVPASGTAGTAVDVSFGGLEPSTHYWVALRAVDKCGMAGPFSVAELTTTAINFTKLSGCFVATAAYGSALQPQVEALRTVRDAVRPRSPLFATATDLYYRSGPAAAAVVGRSADVRAVVRMLLAPVVDVAQAISPFIAPSGTVRPLPHAPGR